MVALKYENYENSSIELVVKSVTNNGLSVYLTEICEYLQNPSLYEANATESKISIATFIEEKSKRNAVLTARRLCGVYNKIRGIKFDLPKESDLTNEQVQHQYNILSEAKQSEFPIAICANLSATIPSENLAQSFGIPVDVIESILERLTRIETPDLPLDRKHQQMCETFKPPPVSSRLVAISSDEVLKGRADILPHVSRMLFSDSLADKIAAMRDVCNLTTKLINAEDKKEDDVVINLFSY